MQKPETPLQWMDYMSSKLQRQAAEGKKYTKYYDAEDTPLSYAQQKFREVFGHLFYNYKDNFCALIVDSISERLSIKGFRFGDAQEADKDAQEIWQRNYLDADSNAAHIDALVQGSSYLLVWGDDDDEPVISPESATEVTVQYQAGSRRRLEAGYREYTDDWGVTHGTLWWGGSVYTAIRGAHEKWRDLDDNENPIKVVPIVPLNNRKRLRSTPFSELAGITPIQDAINKVSADAIVASEFAAFPQRVITGVEPLDNEDEERERMLKAYIDRILALDGENVKFGQFAAADLSNYVRLIEMLVQHMASQSRVPFHYFLLNGGQAPSGESITSAEAGLVAKARERMLHFGEAWEEAMRLAFLVRGDARARDFEAEVIWADPEHRQKSALTDALGKAGQLLSVPKRQLWEDYGYSPKQISRFREMREEEAAFEAYIRDKYGLPEEETTTTTSASSNGSVERQRAARLSS